MKWSRVYLIGFMGAGKTTVGQVLAGKLGWKFIDLDSAIEQGEQRSVADIFRRNGEPHFRNLERKYLRRLSSEKRTIIALGGGTFIDHQNRDLAEKTGLTVWLKVSFAKAAGRVKIDGTRPKFGNAEQARQLYESREPHYAVAKIHISTDEGTPETAANEIIGALRMS